MALVLDEPAEWRVAGTRRRRNDRYRWQSLSSRVFFCPPVFPMFHDSGPIGIRTCSISLDEGRSLSGIFLALYAVAAAHFTRLGLGVGARAAVGPPPARNDGPNVKRCG
jgi:hypothetical protein